MQVYFNQMQREVCAIAAHTSVIVAGRGTGKGLLHAAINLRNFQAMPRSTTAIVAPNAIRAKTNTIPSMSMHWEAWGYKRGLHWEIGKRPDKKLGWQLPLIVPENWDNIISFYNGSIAQIISQDRIGTSNSKSFDFIDIDEAKFIDFDQLKNETFQANRGQQREFGECPWHHGMLITSDMPLTHRGSWFLNYEKKQTADLVEGIEGLLAERAHWLAQAAQIKAHPDQFTDLQKKHNRWNISYCDRYLSQLRRHCTLYRKYSSLTNMEVLGEEYIRQQKRDLPPLIFQTSILCIPVHTVQGGFYSSLKPSHKYTAANFSYLDNLPWQPTPSAPDCRADADIQTDRPLCIAFDFNRNINWLVCGQPDEGAARLNTLRAFYVKYDRKLPALIQDFCRYYNPLPRHEVVFYYDSTALGSNYAVNNEDFKYVITQELHKNGWTVQPVYIGQPMNHAEKHLLINRAFDGGERLTPYFNEVGCADLLVSIQTAGVYNGKKDKRGEKLAETEEDRLEARTDGSDAWDTLFLGCEKFPQTARAILGASSNWN